MNDSDLRTIQKFYSGFRINEPVGNNQFSWHRRKHKSIWVPPLVRGLPDELRTGSEIVFAEIDESCEYAVKGLHAFLYFEHKTRPVFIFDNHNHAFFFWFMLRHTGSLSADSQLMHVDQHSDMRRPPYFLNKNVKAFDIASVFRYTNFELNVGNFIKPALELNWFKKARIINSNNALKINPGDFVPFVLDLDMDFFAPEMEYIDFDFKKARILSYMRKASAITIATSPYFMDQETAINRIRDMFAGC